MFEVLNRVAEEGRSTYMEAVARRFCWVAGKYASYLVVTLVVNSLNTMDKD